MVLYHPNENEQVGAIKNTLATAPQIQKQLKEKFVYGENMLFDLDLIEYRIHNSCKDIAEDLDVVSLYGGQSVSSAFRGHHNEEFLPEYRFEGLFGEQLNDIIEDIRHSFGRKSGRKAYELGLGIFGMTAEELSELGRRGGRKAYELGLGIFGMTAEERSEIGRKSGRKNYELGLGIHGKTDEERSEIGRKVALARGDHIWSLDELVSLHEIREESVGKGNKKTRPCMNYVTEKFNERHETDFTKKALTLGYFRNKHRLSEEGVEIAEPFWSLDKILSLHEIREESVGKGFFKTKPCMNYVTEEFNEQHGTDLTKKALNIVYIRNKHRLSEEE